MPSIANTLGVGSGVDTSALIDALVAAERKPQADALTARGDKVAARISGHSQVASALSALVAAMASRTKGGALGPLPQSSDSATVAARATAGATRALQSTSIEVQALAAGQSLVSGRIANGPVGQGVLTVTFGTLTPDGQGDFSFAGAAGSTDITIGPADDSAAGVAAAINRAKIGLSASVIDDGQGSRLVLKGPSGAKSAFILTSSDPGLDRFDYRPGTASMTSAAAARDAQLVVDGVSVTRPSNTVTDLLPGVALTLVKTSTAPVTVSASRDTAGLATAVSDLVDALNALHDLTASLSSPGSDGGAAGALAGDQALRQLGRNLGSLAGSGGGLASLGVTTARDGTLSVDQPKLVAALDADPDAVEATLAGLNAPGGALTRAGAPFGTGTDASLTREQTAVKAATTALDDRMTTLRAALVKQYAAMDTAVAGFKATQSFLDEQIKAWNNSTNN